MIETILQLLKSEDHNARVTIGDAWIVWSKTYKTWVLYQKKYGSRKTTEWVFDSIESEFDAVRALVHSQEL